MGPDSVENAIPMDIIDIAIDVEAKEIDRSEANKFSDIEGEHVSDTWTEFIILFKQPIYRG